MSDPEKRYPLHLSVSLPEARRLYEFAMQNSAGPGGGADRTFLQLVHVLAGQCEGTCESAARRRKRELTALPPHQAARRTRARG